MTQPLDVAGVGKGAQTCTYRIKATIAIPQDDGSSELFQWPAPIVEGDGANIPGLLGMDSLGKNRAIIDIGNKRLIYPGPGPVEFTFPPG